jgi:hypothetical protein
MVQYRYGCDIQKLTMPSPDVSSARCRDMAGSFVGVNIRLNLQHDNDDDTQVHHVAMVCSTSSTELVFSFFSTATKQIP